MTACHFVAHNNRNAANLEISSFSFKLAGVPLCFQHHRARHPPLFFRPHLKPHVETPLFSSRVSTNKYLSDEDPIADIEPIDWNAFNSDHSSDSAPAIDDGGATQTQLRVSSRLLTQKRNRQKAENKRIDGVHRKGELPQHSAGEQRKSLTRKKRAQTHKKTTFFSLEAPPRRTQDLFRSPALEKTRVKEKTIR